jgi:histone deacetylase 1/2
VIENYIGQKIKWLHIDNGGEFVVFKKYLKENKIQHTFSCPFAHQQNCIIERKHRHIVDTVLTILAHSKLAKTYWVEAVKIVVYLINRLPLNDSQNQSLLELLFKRKPNYNHLKVFGCKCFPNLRPFTKHKFNFKSTPCIFLGYPPQHNGYRCYSPKLKRFFIS